MNITVDIKNVYGNELIYPVCEKAQILARLIGAKTFTSSKVRTLKELGYSFEVVSSREL